MTPAVYRLLPRSAGSQPPGEKPRGLELLDEFFQSQTRLLQYALESARLERFVLRNDNRAAVFAQNEVRAGLTKLAEAETFQGANCLKAVDIPRNSHATARIGS